MVHGLYVEVGEVIDKFLPRGIHFYYICGGRGLGKTYSALHECRLIGTGEKEYLGHKGKFIYLRRTAVEAQSIASEAASAFKKYNANEGTEINADFTSKLGYGNFYADSERTQQIGYVAALSTFSNLRGIDYSDVSFIFYDECIPENTAKAPLKREGFLFMNMVETINRNRALEGLPECVVLLCSNPIDLGHELLIGTNLTPILSGMIANGQERYTDYERSLHIERYINHKVSQLKGETSVLYKFAKGTGFNDEALSGEFVNNDLSKIRKMPIREYVPLCSVENIYMYTHKTDSSLFISTSKSTSPLRFSAGDKEKIRKFVYWKYKQALLFGTVFYDSYNTKAVFENLIGYRADIR